MKSPVSGKTIDEINNEFVFPDEGKKFEFNQLSALLTFPQSKLNKNKIMEKLKEKLGEGFIKCCLVSEEHHKDGSLHYHTWLEFNKKLHVRNPRYFDIEGEHPNIGKMKNKKKSSRGNVIKYLCKEDEAPLCFNIDPQLYLENEKKHKKRDDIGDKLINKGYTPEQIVQEYPSEIYNYDKLKANVGAYRLNTLKDIPPLEDALWIWGPSGCGKTYWVHKIFGYSLYQKESNKWWDGYTGQENVLIDDLDTPVLGHYLKIWGDIYPKSGEIKGGHIPLPYKRIIITSNYLIEDLFKENKIMIGPLLRRFRVKTVMGSYPNFYLEDGPTPHLYEKEINNNPYI